MLFSRWTQEPKAPNQEASAPDLVAHIPLAKASDMAEAKVPGAGRAGGGSGCVEAEQPSKLCWDPCSLQCSALAPEHGQPLLWRVKAGVAHSSQFAWDSPGLSSEIHTSRKPPLSWANWDGVGTLF